MDIDTQAPARAGSRAQVLAPPDLVWDLLADIDSWPLWDSEIEDAHVLGPLRPGTEFRWKAGPGTITSVLQSTERPREIGWTGRTMGIRAVHVWRLEPFAGGTRVTTEESWSGLPVRLARGRMSTTLQRAVEGGLGRLKAEAERLAEAERSADAKRLAEAERPATVELAA